MLCEFHSIKKNTYNNGIEDFEKENLMFIRKKQPPSPEENTFPFFCISYRETALP